MNLKRYVKLSSRGLFGNCKRLFETELEGNLKELIIEYKMAGFSEEKALEKAIKDFGPAQKISADMMEVYLVPKIVKTSLIASIMAAISISVFTASNAQVEVISSETCITCPKSLDDAYPGQSWLKISSLATQFRNIGTTVDSFAHGIGLTLHLPENKLVTIMATHILNNEYYIDTNDFLDQLRQTNLPITLNGWHNPILSINKTTLTIGSPSNVSVDPSNFYFTSLLYNLKGFQFVEAGLVSYINFGSDAPSKVTPGHKTMNAHEIQVNANDEEVFALISWRGKDDLLVDIAPSKDGKVTMHAQTEKLEFAKSAEQFDQNKLSNKNLVLLLKLTGRIDYKAKNAAYKIVVPGDLTKG